MPENTEVLTTKEETLAPEVEKNDSGTDSDSDDSIPELEDTGAGAQTQGNMCKQDKRKGYIFIIYDIEMLRKLFSFLQIISLYL